MSDPPSSVMRAPKRTRAGCDTIFPASDASPRPKSVAAETSGEGTNENSSPMYARSAREPHQDEVVALREDLLVLLLRALGRDDEIEPVRAPLGGDPDRVLRRDCSNRVSGIARADVMGLVDHDQRGLTICAVPPQGRQNRLRHDRLFLERSQRPEVDDETRGVRAATSSTSEPGSSRDHTCQRPISRFRNRRQRA